jgi:hypothetical protein
VPVVDLLKGEWVFEHVARGVEGDAVFGVVRGRLGIVPFEFAILHNTTDYP